MKKNNNILDAIGNTPLVRLEDILIKCEFMNPSGSIKARIAKYMVEKAEEEGLLKPGDTIVEATSGNTGNAFSMVAAVKGYKSIVIMPSGFSEERVAISKAYGAEIIIVGHFDVSKAMALAIEMGRRPNHWCPEQFFSEWNIEENREVLGKEILKQLPKGIKIDALVQGVGTGGTLIGVGQALREKFPDVKIFAMEPDEASTIRNGEFREHLIEGISDGFIPGIIQRNREMIDDIIPIKGADAIEAMKYLAKEYGYFVGPSSGANYLAGLAIRKKFPKMKNVLTFFCDEGEKYIDQHYREKS